MSQVQIVGEEQPQADVRPVPPRYRWLIRGFVIVVVCVAALATLRVAWGRHQWSKLESTVAQIAARGEPIRFEDMQRAPIADADNAAWYYRKAMATWPRVGSQNQLITETDWAKHNAVNATGPRPPDPITDNTAYLASLEPVLDLLRRAGDAPDCDLGVHLQSPVINTFFSQDWSDRRRLARQIGDAARRAHELGRDDLNLELTWRMLQIADRFNVRPQAIIGHLLAGSIRVLAIDHIQQTLPAWRLGADPAGADRVLVQRILDNLLDESKHVDEIRQALIGERWLYYDTMLAVIDGSFTLSHIGGSPPSSYYVLSAVAGPVSVADLNDMLVSFDRLLRDRDAFAHSNALQRRVEESFGHRIDVGSQGSTPRLQLQYWLGNILLAAFDQYVRTHIRFLTRCRLSAAAIAIRLYEIDHGQRPEALDALVPAYLPSVPLDPYGPIGQPVRYRREGVVPEINPEPPYSYQRTGGQKVNPLDAFETPKAMPLVYSVGDDGADNGGLWMLEHDGGINHDRQNGVLPSYDQVFPLESLQAPVKKSAVTPADTSEDGGDSPGSPGLDQQGRVPGGEGDAQREEGEEQRP